MSECSMDKPAVNVKCIVFTVSLCLGYWYLPPRNKWILALLLYFPYLILAYYDHYYDCKRNMGPTYLAMFYEKLKPQSSRQIVTYKNWCTVMKRKIFIVDSIVSILVIIIFFGWFRHWQPTQHKNVV